MEIIKQLLANQYFVFVGMAVVIFLLTQILKMPIKHFTKKIKIEKTRKLVNSVILLIPFILGVCFEFALCLYIHTTFSVLEGVKYGATAISLYGAVAQFCGFKNEYETAQGKEALKLVSEMAKDGKIDKHDTSAIADYLKKVK